MPGLASTAGGGLWLAVVLYLGLFFLVLHFVDRLSRRRPEEDEA